MRIVIFSFIVVAFIVFIVIVIVVIFAIIFRRFLTIFINKKLLFNIKEYIN